MTGHDPRPDTAAQVQQLVREAREEGRRETGTLLAEAQHELGVRAQIITNLQDERAKAMGLVDKAHRMVQRLRDEAHIINSQTQAVVRVLLSRQKQAVAYLCDGDFKSVEFTALERSDTDTKDGTTMVFRLRPMTDEERERKEAHIAKVEALQEKIRKET